MPTAATKSKRYFYLQGQSQGHYVIDLGVIWKGIISEERMPNMKALSLVVQKLEQMLKLTTDKQINRQTNKQTGQKQYAPDYSIRGH